MRIYPYSKNHRQGKFWWILTSKFLTVNILSMVFIFHHGPTTVNMEKFAGLNFCAFHSFQEHCKSFFMNASTSLQLYYIVKYFWPRHHKSISVKTSMGLKLRMLSPANLSTSTEKTNFAIKSVSLFKYFKLTSLFCNDCHSLHFTCAAFHSGKCWVSLEFQPL